MIKGLQLLKSKGVFGGVLGHTPDGLGNAQCICFESDTALEQVGFLKYILCPTLVKSSSESRSRPEHISDKSCGNTT